MRDGTLKTKEVAPGLFLCDAVLPPRGYFERSPLYLRNENSTKGDLEGTKNLPPLPDTDKDPE